MVFRSELPPAEKLRAIRQRCGFSMAELAKLLDFKGSSSYQRYEDVAVYPGELPLKLVQKLLPIVEGRGTPPVTKSDVLALAGLPEAFPVDEAHGHVPSPDETLGTPEAPVDSFQMIPLFDVRVSAGPGALVETDGQPVGHVPFDPAWLKSITYAPPQKLALVRISGDSMWETLHDGDQALVDLTVRKPSRDGIYVLRHEEDVLVKRLQVRFDVQKIEVISDNPKYKSYLASPEDVKVVGRVIWIGRQV